MRRVWLVALFFAVFGSSVALADGESSCASFHPTRASWESHRYATAKTMVRCGTLVGMRQAEIWRLLGAQPYNSWIVDYDNGTTTDLGVLFGPGPVAEMRVE